MASVHIDLAAANVRPALNRVIRIAGRPGDTRVALEDDFHHFRVAVRHDDRIVTGVETEGVRVPWSLCPAAGLELRALVGTPIHADMTLVFRRADARFQCTHQFDMAALAIAAAARGTVTRRYDVRVDDCGPAPRHAHLARDGEPLLDWMLDDSTIVAPAPFAGRGIGAGFTAWAAESLEPELSEAALVLRRGVFISYGRGLAAQLDAMAHSPDTGGCWVQQPAQAKAAVRRRGSQRDFTGRQEALTRGDEDWLAGA